MRNWGVRKDDRTRHEAQGGRHEGGQVWRPGRKSLPFVGRVPGNGRMYKERDRKDCQIWGNFPISQRRRVVVLYHDATPPLPHFQVLTVTRDKRGKLPIPRKLVSNPEGISQSISQIVSQSRLPVSRAEIQSVVRPGMVHCF